MKKGTTVLIAFISAILGLTVSAVVTSILVWAFDFELDWLMGGISSFSTVLLFHIIRRQYMKKKDPEALKQENIEHKDERNMNLTARAGNIAWNITVFISAITAGVLMFLDYTMPAIIVASVILLSVVVNLVTLAVLRKKY